MSVPAIQSIQVGLPRQLGTPGAEERDQQPWFSGFIKQPVTGSVELTWTGLKGDGQADLKNHGGPDKAILSYSADHFSDWASSLQRSDVVGGMFGENLTITGLTEEEVCIGDIFAIGSVQVQISQPRQPCWKLARHWKEPQLPKLVVRNGRCGWYCRVLKVGSISTGQTFELITRPHPDWTVRRAHHTMYGNHPNESANLDIDRSELAAIETLSESWQIELQKRLGSPGDQPS